MRDEARGAAVIALALGITALLVPKLAAALLIAMAIVIAISSRQG